MYVPHFIFNYWFSGTEADCIDLAVINCASINMGMNVCLLYMNLQ
jgi:hypothetical protein